MSSCILVPQFFLTYGSKLVLCLFKDLIEEVAEYSFKRYRVHDIIFLFTINRGKYNSNWGLVRNIFSGHKRSIAGEELRCTSFVWSPWPPNTLHCANKKRIQTSLLTLFWSPKLLQYSVQLKLCSANFHRRFFFLVFENIKKISLNGWRTPRL